MLKPLNILLKTSFGDIIYTYEYDVILSTIKCTLSRLVEKYTKWISANERITNYYLQLKDWPLLLGSIDATLQEINNPHLDNDPFISRKYKFSCETFQAFVSPIGLLIHFPKSFPGRVYDFQVFKNSRLLNLILVENDNCLKI